MSVEKVEATLDEKTTQLYGNRDSIYQGHITAPEKSGTYEMKIAAYDFAGNISTADGSTSKEFFIEVTQWSAPKTNWTTNDRFNISDYNRIKNNLKYLNELGSSLYKEFSIRDMGEDKEETLFYYKGYWDYHIFNYFEENLEIINKNTYTQNYGISQAFYGNGAFIQPEELNRIESACLSIYEILHWQKSGLIKLSFKLGNMKGVKI